MVVTGLLLAGVVALVVMLVVKLGADDPASASAEPSPPPPAELEVMGTSQLAAEARTAMDQFEGEFPDGFVFPDVDLLLQEFLQNAGGQSSFEEGFGAGFVLEGWQCAWQQELATGLDAQEQARVDAAVAEMSRFYDFALTQQMYEDPDRAWYQQNVTDALDGNTSTLESAVAGCGTYLEPLVPGPSV